jgi:hypothetical protein
MTSFLLVFHVARVAESHEQPDLGWLLGLWSYLEEDGSEDDISYQQTRTSA